MLKQRCSCSSWEGKLSCCNSWRSVVEQGSTCSPGVPHAVAGWYAQGRLWSHRKPVLEQAFGRTWGSVEGVSQSGAAYSWETAPCGKDRLKHFVKNWSPQKELTFQKFMESSHRRHPKVEQGSAVPFWGIRSGWDNVELTAAPIPWHRLQWEEADNSGVKLSPERIEQWAEGAFKMWIYFSLFYSDLTGDKLN